MGRARRKWGESVVAVAAAMSEGSSITSTQNSNLDDGAFVPTQNSNLDDGAFVPKGIDKACPRATWPATGKKRASVPITEEQVRGIFHRYDTNRDGLLSKQELKNAFSSLGSRMPGVRAWLALQHADVNGDGYISEAEFDKLVKYTLKRGYKIN
ncbi:hypothetical protein Goshw_016672 [Gossypium schwendimanii]|uniref:EF-hand domain-containing protein n=1 Tax=Gossypium schwendimanii TaxID=34291 RepID=A0A7J9KSW2_GOSSC|nr:hypothetical protein [Gossypium schwendimanii]